MLLVTDQPITTGMPTPTRMTMIKPDHYTQDLSLLKLMHLCSVSLPVGGYSFSHGLEYAIDEGWVRSPEEVHNWVEQQVFHGQSQVDLPIILHVMKSPADTARIQHLNDLILACRESKELRMTDLAMGEALYRLLPTLGVKPVILGTAAHGHSKAPAYSFAVLFAQACSTWGIAPHQACLGYLWSWVEGQVAAACKLVPLGQTAAQALIAALQPSIPLALERAGQVEEDDIGSSLPGLAMASALHETQYSRLFRS